MNPTFQDNYVSLSIFEESSEEILVQVDNGVRIVEKSGAWRVENLGQGYLGQVGDAQMAPPAG